MAPDNPGLFSEIAAAISTQEINIETAKIFTRKDGIAADFFGYLQEIDWSLISRNLKILKN